MTQLLGTKVSSEANLFSISHPREELGLSLDPREGSGLSLKQRIQDLCHQTGSHWDGSRRCSGLG